MTLEEVTASLADSDWVFPGVPRRGTRLLIVGPSRCGRTTLVCELALAVSTGTPFYDLAAVGGASPTLLVSGDPDLARRLRAAQYRRAGYETELLHVEPRALILTDEAQRRALSYAIEVLPPHFVVFDDIGLCCRDAVGLFQLNTTCRPGTILIGTACAATADLLAWANHVVEIVPYSRMLQMPWEVRVDGKLFVRYRLVSWGPDPTVPHLQFWPATDLTDSERDLYAHLREMPHSTARASRALNRNRYFALTLLRSLYDRGFVTCCERRPYYTLSKPQLGDGKLWTAHPVPFGVPLSPGGRALMPAGCTTEGRRPAWRELFTPEEVLEVARIEQRGMGQG